MIPSVRIGLRGFWRRQKVVIITQDIIDHKISELKDDYVLRIMAVPMPQEKVSRKPEESRSWRWANIYCESTFKLKHDDKIIIANKIYKIDGISDWSISGVMVYDAIEDYVEKT